MNITATVAATGAMHKVCGLQFSHAALSSQPPPKPYVCWAGDKARKEEKAGLNLALRLCSVQDHNLAPGTNPQYGATAEGPAVLKAGPTA